MEYLNKIINLQQYKLETIQENIEMVIYSIIGFTIPFLIGQPQIVVGITVNTMLITSALNLKSSKLLPIIIAPSLGVLSRGLIFGPLSIYLLYFIPFIWIANTILILTIKWLKLKLNKNYLLALISGAGLKTIFLFLIALLLYSLNLVPAIFLTAMGLTQLITAFCGGIIAHGIQEIKTGFKQE